MNPPKKSITSFIFPPHFGSTISIYSSHKQNTQTVQKLMEKTKILYIGDDTSFFQEIKETLRTKDIKLIRRRNFEKAAALFQMQPPHMVVAEAPEEGVSGLALCQEVRTNYGGLFVLLSQQEKVDFHILALDLGADGSFKICDGPQYLVANILALLKRYVCLHAVKELTFGPLTIDSRKRDVFISGQPAELSTIEFQLIWSLAKRHGNVVSRDEIHHELYKCPYNGYDRTIDLYISRIRQKIGDAPGSSQYLKTVRGIGYQFVPAQDSDFRALNS